MEDQKAYFTSAEVCRILGIDKSDLYTILRPVRSKGKLLPPIFKPESSLNKLTQANVFTQRDIIRMKRYFKALKEYKAAREDLRKQSNPVPKEWMQEENDSE